MKKSQLIKQLILEDFNNKFSNIKHEVVVETSDEYHFAVTVISNAFENKKLLERQRMIYGSLGDKFATGEIHALSIKTFTSEEAN